MRAYKMLPKIVTEKTNIVFNKNMPVIEIIPSLAKTRVEIIKTKG